MKSKGPVYLAGPTAVGKSDLAVALAERLNGEIVSADAFQVYLGMDILTAKPDPATLQRVPHHLIGEIPLTESFDVARYHALATQRIAAISERGSTPIVVGGTGLYLRALTQGLAELPAPDEALRADLTAQPLEQLLRRLDELDPDAAQRIDRKNPRRVIRALEVCLLTGRPFSSFREQWEQAPEVRAVFVNRNRDDLYRRIEERTVAMFGAGVVEEVRAIQEIGSTAAQAIGYRDIRAFIDGEGTSAECLARIQQQTRNYAKRQLTWFRKERHFQTVELGTKELLDAALERVVAAIGKF